MIDSDGQQLGVMATSDAQRIADEKELDLVEVAPTASAARLPDHGLREVQVRREEEGAAVAEEDAPPAS